MSSKLMQGTCLCGAVSLSANNNTEVEACHCGMCRRWGGGPFLAIHCGSDVSFSGEDNITKFSSSDWATRAFCSKCGTHLYYHFKPANAYIVPAGLFQQQDSLVLKEQIFIDNKPPYYDFANDTAKLTEAQVLAKYAPD